MAKGSGGYGQRKRITEIEEVIKGVPTDQQVQEQLFTRVVIERFVQVPEIRALIHRQWRLSLQGGNEKEQDQIRREVTKHLEKFLKEEAPEILVELQIGDELESLNEKANFTEGVSENENKV